MVNKCTAPGCKAGYDSSDNKTVISTFRFPADESRRKIWTSRVPRLNWTYQATILFYAKNISRNLALKLNVMI